MAVDRSEFGFHLLGNDKLASTKGQVRTLSQEAVATFLSQFKDGERDDVAAELMTAIVDSSDDPTEAARDLRDELDARLNGNH